MKRTKKYEVTSAPMVAIDGKNLGCSARGKPTTGELREARIGPYRLLDIFGWAYCQVRRHASMVGRVTGRTFSRDPGD